MHCSLKAPDVAPVVLGCCFKTICTAHALRNCYFRASGKNSDIAISLYYSYDYRYQSWSSSPLLFCKLYLALNWYTGLLRAQVRVPLITEDVIRTPAVLWVSVKALNVAATTATGVTGTTVQVRIGLLRRTQSSVSCRCFCLRELATNLHTQNKFKWNVDDNDAML